MLGSAEEWFYRRLGGMDIDLSRDVPDERLTIRPVALAGLDWVHCGFDSKLGKVESDWDRKGSAVRYTVTVPVAATIVLPSGAVSDEGEGSLRSGDSETVFRVRPGTWNFTLQKK